LERILDIAIQVAWGLGYAHGQGLVHQDVKPGNVLMTVDGLAKVTDFGLARARQPTIGGDLLVSTAGGTPTFRSPEQARRERLSVQTDIWSWGVSVLEMFAGEMFWQYGEAADEVLDGFLEEGAYLPDVPKMPAQVAELLQQCFQRDPAERPKDMLEIAGRLQEIYQQETGQAHPRQMPKAIGLRADSLNNKALSLLDLGKDQEAQTAWDAALQSDPYHLESIENLLTYHWKIKRDTFGPELFASLRNQAEKHPEDWQRWLRLLVMYQDFHYNQGAEYALKKILQLAPEEEAVAAAARLI
jgi:serine/threonine protein kinase